MPRTSHAIPRTPSDDRDLRLVEESLQGSERAFAELYDAYAPKLRNFATQSIGDSGSSDDLVQETFLRVHRHLKNFNKCKKFSTWVYTILSNLCRNEVRNRRRERLVTFSDLQGSREDEVEFSSPLPRPDEECEMNDLRDRMLSTINVLPTHFRRVLVLREVRAFSYNEIGLYEEILVGTVRSRLNRARRDFWSRMGPFNNL